MAKRLRTEPAGALKFTQNEIQLRVHEVGGPEVTYVVCLRGPPDASARLTRRWE